MGLLDIFKSKPESSSTYNGKRELTPVSEVTAHHTIEQSSIVTQSEIPASTKIGNLTFDKQYESAIQEGLRQLKKNPNDAGVHINLMVAYFKARETNPDYFDRSSYHAKMAILNGHHTGYAEDRLAKNLDKQKKYHQTIQLCDLVLRDDFHFTEHGCGNAIDFSTRKGIAQQRINKASDNENDLLFTPEEIEQIISDIKKIDVRNAELKAEYAMLERQRDQAMSKALKTNHFTEVDRIMKRMSEISNQIVY